MMLRTLVLLSVAVSCATAGFPDLDPPKRKKPYDSLVIEWVSQEPKVLAAKVGDRSEPAEGTSIVYTAHLRNLAASASGPLQVHWSIDGAAPASVACEAIEAGARTAASFKWVAAKGRHWVRCEVAGRGEWITFATDALTVKVAVERRTLEKYEAEHGSFARRMQDSLAGLHASWSAVREPRFAPEGIEERLRIDDVEAYERTADAAAPKEFGDHPRFHLYVACDQGGPQAGFSIPGYSIGHNYGGHPGHESLFSDWGENCLWHEIGHFRGVEDLYIFPTRKEQVEKTDARGNPLEGLRLAEPYAKDTMNDPYRETSWSDYSTAIIQAKRGVTRVDRCEDPTQPYGHMWKDIPEAIEIEVVSRDGTPVRGMKVEVYRPVRPKPGDSPRVAADAMPVVSGATDAQGRLALGKDLFAGRAPEPSRATWVLLVLTRQGDVRARYLSLIDANLAYWKGERDHALFRIPYDSR